MKLKVACVQMEHRDSVEANFTAAEALTREAVEGGAEMVLLPEYFFAPGEGGPGATFGRGEDVSRFLEETSRRAGAVLAGNAVMQTDAGLRNTLFVYDAGKLVGRQDKIHPMPKEFEAGIRGGSLLEPFPLRDVSAGALVCADVMYPEASRVLSLKGAEVLLNPVMSPYRKEDPTKVARDAVYVARAWDAGAFVLKAGGFHKTTRRAVGRSLIAAPWGVEARYKDEWAEEILTAELDLEKLREFRKLHRGFQARMPEAYRSLLD